MRTSHALFATLFTVLGGIALASPTFAASWYSPTSGTTATLNGVDGYGSTAIAVGTSGKIIRSTNYGTAWSTVTAITTSTLNGVDMEGTHAVAVGNGGTILYSSNSGATWTAAASGTTSILYGVSMSTTGTAFAVGFGGVIQKSTDYGVTWTTTTPVTAASLRSVTVWNSTTAYAVGTSGTVLYYNGTTWTAQTSGSSATLLSVSMASSMSIWVGGAGGVVLKSNGTTWSSVTITGLGSFDDVNGISMNTGVNEGTLVASNDGAYETSDGGVTWKLATTGTWTGATWLAVRNFSTNRLAVSFSGTVRRYDGMAPGNFTSVSFNGTPTSGSTIYSGTATQMVTWSAVTDEGGGEILYYIKVDSGSWAVTADVTYTTAALAAGNHTIALRAVDVYGTYNTTVTQNVFFDVTGPTVGSFAPTSATTVVATLFSVTASDSGSGVDVCYFDRDSAHLVELTDPDLNGTFTGGYTFTTAESYDGNVSCYDYAGNRGADIAINFVISVRDTTAPTVGLLIITTDAVGSPTSFSFSASDTSGIDLCTVIIQEGNFAPTGFHASVTAYGAPSAIFMPATGRYYATYTFTDAGNYYAYAHCTDAVGNNGYSDYQSFTISAPAALDTTNPIVAYTGSTSAVINTPMTFSATYADASTVSVCSVYNNSTEAHLGIMTLAAGRATFSYTFTSAGTYSIGISCVDASDNVGTTTFSITVTNTAVMDDDDVVTPDPDENVNVVIDDDVVTVTEEVTNDTGEAEPGSLIKLACSEGAGVNDPCKAVYFYARHDMKRHAFPNEKVFFTWYGNFDNIVVVSNAFMASLTLGRNITYHPGTRMVKFISVNTVYAVTRGGTLRPINSEATAISLYGSNWNRQIDDISDAFYGNYDFGDDVTGASDYDKDNERTSITDIDTNLAF